MHDIQWLAVVPLKPPAVAKSRLRGALPEVPHAELVLAMLLDTVRAVGTCPRVRSVVVVCDDAAARAAAEAVGARAVADVPAAGLNAALAFGAEFATGTARRCPVVALTGDLPSLTPAELTGALDAAARVGARGFVPDAEGSGTVLLAAPSAAELAPAFGARSASEHAAAGVHRLAGPWPGLRRDVDRANDLAAAARLGLGPHTRALLAAARMREHRTPAAAPVGGAGTVWGMRTLQGTVATFDTETEAGSVLLDDGSEVEFSPAAFAASELRMVRPGQRIRLECSDDGTVVRVALITMS